MRRTLNAQTCGSVIVIATFVASEASARLLEMRPDSALLWWINLELFRPFEAARVAASPLRPLFGPLSLAGGLAALALALFVRYRRFRFGVALIANLSFVFSAVLASIWLRGRVPHEAASLAPLFVEAGSSAALVEMMLAASCLGVCLSHASFFAAIRVQARDRRPPGRGAAGGTPPPRLPQTEPTGVAA